MNKMNFKPLLLGCLALISMLGCRIENAESSTHLSVVCTTGMIGDAVKNILPADIEVFTLMGPGVDPHLYKPSPEVVAQLSQADIIVHNGLHLEGKMGDIFNALKDEKIVLEMSGGLKESQLLKSETDASVHDPHIWFDVDLWQQCVGYLGQQLSKIDGLDAVEVSNNTQKYQKTLQQLHQWVKAKVMEIPKGNRIMITSHDAFRYFGRAYDIRVMGLQGISTVSEFGLKDITNLVQFVVDHRVPAVFVESSVSSKSMQAVQEGCKNKGHNLVIGGTMYSDAMGAADGPEGNYVGMVKHNATILTQALNVKQ